MLSLVARFSCAVWIATSLLGASSFSGTVVDAASGKPIPGAIVTLGSKIVRTGAKGEFKIEGDEDEVSARAYGYSRTKAKADPHGEAPLRLKLSAVTPHGLYLSYWGIGTPSIREAVLRLAGATPVNAVVIDVKGDLGYLCYRTSVPMANEIGAEKQITVPDMPALLARLHKQGIVDVSSPLKTICLAKRTQSGPYNKPGTHSRIAKA